MAWYRTSYVQVLAAIGLGVLLGTWFPKYAQLLKPLGDGFTKLVKLMIAPIVFCTITHGIASMGDLKRLGRTGLRALIYFELVSTLALILGLLVVNLVKPGLGLNLDVRVLDASVGKSYLTKAHASGQVDFLLNIIPTSFLGAFASGDLLQVLFCSILTAFAISLLPEGGQSVLKTIEEGSKVCFAMMNIIVKFAPLGALGAMGYTVGSFGLHSLHKLLSLMLAFYVTAGLFVGIVLGGIMRACGVSLIRYLSYIKQEIFLVLGTSSSETALPGLMRKLEGLGCANATVGLVVPTGYSFNLDGTNIYMTMAAVFLAQATNTPLDLKHQLGLLLVAMITSKGASGVAGAGFVTLAATLEAVPGIPLESLALLVGVDRFMSECRALTNFIGNGVATLAISRWEGEVTAAELQAKLG
ncbi:MAG TPA: C4-dicarboxylate transporter DctA [Pseudomonadota bacterium]|nr:C4-dicarboxylate transporter DctA [Pseudomonadota bacterium]